MAPLIHSRLESTIAVGYNLIDQLCSSSDPTRLDALYTQILSTCVNGDQKSAGELLSIVALLEQPVTPALLVALLQRLPQDITPHLQSFVNARLLTTDRPMDTITDTTSLRVCHPSLHDYVVDPLRCRLEHYLVNSAENHRKLLHRCLGLLNKHLRQNICDIRHPGLANADIPDLFTRIATSLPNAARYACVSWLIHLVASGPASGALSEVMLGFCTDHLLHWLEALSLMGELSSAAERLSQVIEWCQVNTLLYC
jgi:hypothetical protein